MAQKRPGRCKEKFRELFPPFMWVCLICMLAAQFGAFYGTRPLLAGRTLHDLATPLDLRIPLRPAWVTVYFLSYLSWAVNLPLVLGEEKLRSYRIASSYILALMVSGILFLAYPGTLERPEITGTDVFSAWMRFLYRADTPTNLCPSLHVLISYFCWRWTLGSKRIPRWYSWFNLGFLVLVCLSILYVKQHVLMDIPAALAVAEGSWQLVTRLRGERLWIAAENKLKKREKQA